MSRVPDDDGHEKKRGNAMTTRRLMLATALLAASGFAACTRAAWAEDTVKVGVLNDISGVNSSSSGMGSVLAAQMAAEDFMAEAGPGGAKVSIVFADHQNKADIGAQIVRQWIDKDGVDAVVDLPNSAVALAVNQVMREKDRAFLASSTATSDLTSKFCAATTVQWTFDTWALANGTATALVKQGGDSWYFITSDYAFGHALERDATDVVTQAGGHVVGHSFTPLDTTDMSSYLLQAQASKAKVVGLAQGGTDLWNLVKQAGEFGIGRDSQKLTGLLVFIADVDSIGLQQAQGLLLTSAFYWDLNDSTRAWSKRFSARFNGKPPTMNHAGVYSSTLAFLKAQAVAKSRSGTAIVAQMEAAPFTDPLFGRMSVRKDGRAVHDMYLFQVKTPAESKSRWDVYKLVETIPADRAFRPMAQGACPLVKG